MEPRIQYAQTADGVSIAFWTLGEGMPFVYMPSLPFSHIQVEWQIPELRRWFERLAQTRKLIRYDGRGNGLSQRDATDYSLEAHVRDLEAVVDHLALDRFALVGAIHSGPVAVAYAVQNPQRVSQLILWCSYATGADYWRSAPARALRALRREDWEMYTETLAREVMGWSTGQRARRLAAVFRESVTPDVAEATIRATRGFDVRSLLMQVRSPTLVLARHQLRWLDVNLARGLASRIPEARLVLLEGESGAPYVGDWEAVLTTIEEFLGEGEAPARLPPELPSGTAVILFADIVDSTALTERLGDVAFREKARDLDGALRGVIRENGGTPIEGKLLGDGVLAVFTSARQAIGAALRCGVTGDEAGLPLHLGIHAGDVIREEDPDGRANVYGGAVNIAARISALSAPGEVLVSETVRGLARTSAGMSFDDRGEHTLKGVSEPVRVWAVREGARG